MKKTGKEIKNRFSEIQAARQELTRLYSTHTFGFITPGLSELYGCEV